MCFDTIEMFSFKFKNTAHHKVWKCTIFDKKPFNHF